MKKINILEARNNLSRLVAAAVGGEEVIIAKRGTPAVRLVPVEDNVVTHTGVEVARWLTKNPVPQRARRTAAQLDEQIASERESWE